MFFFFFSPQTTKLEKVVLKPDDYSTEKEVTMH